MRINTGCTIIDRILLVVILVVVFSAPGAGQCSSDAALGQKGQILKSVIVDQATPSEIALTVKASAQQTSWLLPGSEAAVLTVLVDGRYLQDIVLFAGANVFGYTVLLGRFETGRYKVEIVFNKVRSAQRVDKVTIISAETRVVKTTDPVDNLALANSPILYVRPDAVYKFSDIPLVTYYEIFREGPQAGRIRYTTVFSNEDGGTQTAALMARWGRATDIEWMYEIGYLNGQRATETYQAANHETKVFNGERGLGEHPYLLTATVNNNFADRGCSGLRIANMPFRVDLSKRSRESVMDEHPWTYLVMSEEAMREGRVDPARMGPNVIDDPRNYLYVDIYSELSNASVSIQLDAADGRASSSDRGDELLRISRSGFQRTAVRLPSSLAEVTAITMSCHRKEDAPVSRCKAQRIVAVTRLDQNYKPVLLKPGEGLRRTIVISSKK